MYYILDAKHNVVSEPDVHKWSRWMDDPLARRVGSDEILPDITLSTMFLPASFSNQNFETMLFRGRAEMGYYDEVLHRYKTWNEAAAGHRRLLRWYQNHCPICDKSFHPASRGLQCGHCGFLWKPLRKWRFLRLPNGHTKVFVSP